MADAYPLAWPVGWKRSAYRTGAKFSTSKNSADKLKKKLTIRDGQRRVLDELGRMNVDLASVTISMSIKPHLLDGQGSNAGDPGVAVYWTQKKQPRVMAVDRYHTIADNLAALAATLEAMRAIERHGGAVVMDRAFEGFAALPAPTPKREWWDVLGVRSDASMEQIKEAWRIGVAKCHPDKPGGSHDAVAAINTARDAGLAARSIK